MIRLLVADDETLVREALATLLGLEDDITVIAQADNGSEAVALAQTRHPDIAASALTEDRSPLTERELDLPRAARGGGTIEDIAAELHLAPGTVRNYLSTAMRKLDKKTRHATAQYAWGAGLVLNPVRPRS